MSLGAGAWRVSGWPDATIRQKGTIDPVWSASKATMQYNTSYKPSEALQLPKGPPHMSRTAIGHNRWPIRSSLTSPKLHVATFNINYELLFISSS